MAPASVSKTGGVSKPVGVRPASLPRTGEEQASEQTKADAIFVIHLAVVVSTVNILGSYPMGFRFESERQYDPLREQRP